MKVSALPPATAGSSPLARGLPAGNSGQARKAGIIPARAGFTAWPAAPGSTSWDHPRSRGVYALQCAAYASAEGSSPLARGLHERARARSRGHGIIPARAGFTAAAAANDFPAADHPRSRGVYDAVIVDAYGSAGSSPLARGLRRLRRHHRRRRGIIPARAGFTTVGWSSPRPSRDHPRSRGVYNRGQPWTASESGSSPLARGLRSAGRC